MDSYLEDSSESDEEKEFNDGDRGNVIYTLLLPLANVLLSIIIVDFTWGRISGSGIVRKGEMCHNNKVPKGMIRIELTGGELPPNRSYLWRLVHLL